MTSGEDDLTTESQRALLEKLVDLVGCLPGAPVHEHRLREVPFAELLELAIVKLTRDRERLQNREQTMRGLLDASLDAILVTDVHGILLEANQNLADRHGKSLGDLIGANIFDQLPAAVAERRQGWLDEIVRTGEPLYQEDERDGRVYENMLYPLLDESGQVSGLAIHSRDVTDRRLAEAAVFDSEHRYRTLIDTIPYGIQENDLHGVITLSNRAHARMLGYDEGELEGKLIWDLLPSDEEKEQLRVYLASLVREQPAPTPYRTPDLTKDGRRIDVQVDWTYKRDLHGRIEGFISVITDITERLRLEKQRAHFVEAIISAQEEERSRIARELHDETGQALSAILVHLSALEARSNRAAAGRISAELRQRVRTLIDDVARLARGLHPRALHDIGFAEALDQYCDDYRRTHEIEVDLHVDRGEVVVGLNEAVKIALFRIAQELLTNVAKHAEAQRVSVVVERSAAGIRMIVEDDGEGFDEAAATGEVDSHGSLGLTGIRERLALLGGRLTIESAPGRGSSLYVDIPAGAGW